MKRNILMLLALLSATPLTFAADAEGPVPPSATPGLDGGKSGSSADGTDAPKPPKGKGASKTDVFTAEGQADEASSTPAATPAATSTATTATQDGMWNRTKRKFSDAFDGVTDYYAARRKGDFENEKGENGIQPNPKHKWHNTQNAVRGRRAADTVGMAAGLGAIAADAYNNVTWSYLQSHGPFLKRFSPTSKIARAVVAGVEALILDFIMGSGIGTRGSLLGAAAKGTYNAAEKGVNKVKSYRSKPNAPAANTPVPVTV